MIQTDKNQQQKMSLQEQSTKDQGQIPQKQFFDYFYCLNSPPSSFWKPLKEKYRNYRQQSYNSTKHTSEISFIKKFSIVSAYVPFIQQVKAERIDIPLIQQTIERIYDEHELFFQKGGWRAVKNKSLVTHLQEYLLLKLWRVQNSGKVQESIGKLILGFFYTVNYYKTCHYEIRLFNDFLLNNDLESLFIFILLRKKSRRINKDLTVNSDLISNFIHVLKGEQNSTSIASYSSEHEEMGEVKLLLIYPEIMEYMKTHGVVLHQILIYSLMKSVGLIPDNLEIQSTSIDWNRFLALYFKELTQAEGNYQQELIRRVVRANLKVADNLFKLEDSSITFTGDQYSKQSRQKFLEQSFSWLIGALESIIYCKKDCSQRWKTMYGHLQLLFEEGLPLGNKLVEQLLRSEDYYAIYCKYLSKGSHDE